MPATTPRPKDAPERKWDRNNAPRYVRCDLNAEQKGLLKIWAEELEDQDLLKWVDDRVLNGHVVSIKSAPTGFMCSLTGDRESSGHSGVALVARASTPIRALVSCMYKDTMVLQGQWPVTSQFEELDY